MRLRRSHRDLCPELHYQPSEANRALLEACPGLRTPYKPAFWATNPHLQIMMYMRSDANVTSLDWDLEEELLMSDGGTVSLQWLGLGAEESHVETPVLFILPTIMGCGDSLRGFVQRMQAELGWIVVVCNRRGHGALPLTMPTFNTLGNTADLRAQISTVQQRRPGAPLFAVGLSAGSGLLARYLGEEAEDSPLQAAVAFCPAYDMRAAFHRLHWFYDVVMTRQLIQYFLVRHEAQLQHVEGYKEARSARSFGALHDSLYALGGFVDADSYYLATNPMEVAHHNRTPALVLNASDDPICTRKGLEDGIASLQGALGSMIIAVTQYGSHCAFFEDARRPRSWAERVMVEYLQAANTVL